MTAHEWAAIALWCHKNGCEPKGNNNYGKDASESGYIAIPTYKDSGGKTCRVATGTGPVTWSHNGKMDGIFDMNGNVWEWVEDCWHDNYSGAPSDGSAWTSGGDCERRVLRGGSFNNDPRYLRSAARFKYESDVRFYTNGFRVAREP